MHTGSPTLRGICAAVQETSEAVLYSWFGRACAVEVQVARVLKWAFICLPPLAGRVGIGVGIKLGKEP